MAPTRTAAASSLALVLLLAGVAAAGGVKVETSRQLYEPGDVIEISVVNETGAPIALPGCGSFQLEKFVDDAYVRVPTENCVSEGEALKVDPGSFALTYTPDSDLSGNILRISVAYGTSCEEGRPLSQARCKDFGTVTSTNFRVGKKTD